MPRNDQPATYENTPENAARIGWTLTPEYCFGDHDAPFVTHDHHHGIFVFHAVAALATGGDR